MAQEIYHEYFYNYFELGLDLLFSERDHCVTRLILHTNAPNSAVFNHYNKADFTLHLKDKQIRANTPVGPRAFPSRPGHFWD